MRKRLISLFIVTVLAFSNCGCARTAEDTSVAESENMETENTEADSEEEVDADSAEPQSEQTAISGERYAQSKEISALKSNEGYWNTWIADETMEGYSSHIYTLESYYKENGIVYVEETLYIGYKDGKWELVQGFDESTAADFFLLWVVTLLSS